MFRDRRIRQAILVFFISIFALSSIFAQGIKQKIRFARGSSSTTISGAVVRGDRDRYYVGAKKGSDHERQDHFA